MQDYNPKAPNELADAQLNRAQYESPESKERTIDTSPPAEPGDTVKESYNTTPGH